MGAADRRTLGDHRHFLAGLAKGRVLELGCGAGFNFSYYQAGGAVAEVVGLEPDRAMLAKARKEAAAAAVPTEVVQGVGESLVFSDESFDCVVATLVLCTVQDPVQTLAEIRRVLRPGGSLLFLEHVRAATRGWAKFQQFIEPGWGFFAGGCHLCRDTGAAIRQSGLSLDLCEGQGYIGWPLLPVIRGVAVKLATDTVLPP